MISTRAASKQNFMMKLWFLHHILWSQISSIWKPREPVNYIDPFKKREMDLMARRTFSTLSRPILPIRRSLSRNCNLRVLLWSDSWSERDGNAVFKTGIEENCNPARHWHNSCKNTMTLATTYLVCLQMSYMHRDLLLQSDVLDEITQFWFVVCPFHQTWRLLRRLHFLMWVRREGEIVRTLAVLAPIFKFFTHKAFGEY